MIEIFGLAIGWPFTWQEQAGFISAIITIIFGLMCFFTPHASLRILRLETRADKPEAISEMRGTLAGFYLGVGLLCIVFAQPLLYVALGAGWAFTAFGRLVSMIFDSPFPKGFSPFNIISIISESALAMGGLVCFGLLF